MNQPPEIRRSELIRSSYRPGEYADLAAIAEDWGVPIGTAVWAIVSERLCEWRAVEPQLGRVGIRRAAVAYALAKSGIATDCAERPPIS